MKTTTLPLRNLVNRSPLRAFPLIPVALACFVLSQQARAACNEGCLTNNNTVLGDGALFNNTTGSANTAIGYQALNQNTTGNSNTAIGRVALFLNTTGGLNTGAGYHALENNTSGSNNMAAGGLALFSNTTGSFNTAAGAEAHAGNSTGNFNTAIGYIALWGNNGNDNTAVGHRALSSSGGNGNTAIGKDAVSSKNTGDNNIAVGFQAGINLFRGSHNIYIGNLGVDSESGVIRIGTPGTHPKTFIAGISGVTVPDGVGVIVGANGKLGTIVSSERFKDAIKPMDKASEGILALRPVTFRYKQELDADGIPQFGLVAEEVEKVNPDLVARDAEGKAYSVRYEAVNAMLLNEFLKEHRKVEQLEKQVAALTAGLQKVSAQLEMSKPVLQPVANNQ